MVTIGCRTCCISVNSIGTARWKNAVLKCLQNNQAIQAERPPLQVIDVGFNPPLDIFFRVDFSTKPVDLGPAANAGSYELPYQVLLHHAGEHFIMFRKMRPRSDDAHVATHHIDELRQFIDAKASQPLACSEDP